MKQRLPQPILVKATTKGNYCLKKPPKIQIKNSKKPTQKTWSWSCVWILALQLLENVFLSPDEIFFDNHFVIQTESLNTKKLFCTLVKLGKASAFRAVSSSLGCVSKIAIYLDAVKCNITANTDFLAELAEDRKTFMKEKTENWERKSESNCHKRTQYLNLKISQSSHPI